MKTLENKVVDDIIEFGCEIDDEIRREQILEGFAEEKTNEFMDEIGLKNDASFALIYPAVLESIKKEINWADVDEELKEIHEDTAEWFHNRMEAIFS